MNQRKPVISFFFIVSLLAVVSGARAESISSKIVDAYGGSEAIERARTLYARGEIKAIMRGDEGTYVRYLKRDGKLRVETVYTRSSELRVLNGKRGWRSMNKNPLDAVEGSPFYAMAYQYKEIDLPYGLLNHQYTITDEGRSKLGDADVSVLDLEDSDHIPIKIYVDLNTYRILRTEGFFMIGGNLASLGAQFSDFRKVNGLLLPFRITNYASGQKISETVIKEYRINMNMPERLFLP